MKILITGNKEFGLAKSLALLYPDADFASRATGFDLTTRDGYKKLGIMAANYDVFINCSALHKFNQTLVLDYIYKTCQEMNHPIHIINVGSTTDRVKKATSWIYNAEKKALRDYSNSLSLTGVWDGGPKVTLISFGSLSNVQAKHPNRVCLDIDRAASYIKWVIDQPQDICINEISIDPLQVKHE
jgi:NADP-dependent 3-hydroxy acid dehydrogenase YdfG